MGSSLSAEEDAKRYRDGYPDDNEDDKQKRANIEFFENRAPSRPHGLFAQNGIGYFDSLCFLWAKLFTSSPERCYRMVVVLCNGVRDTELCAMSIYVLSLVGDTSRFCCGNCCALRHRWSFK